MRIDDIFTQPSAEALKVTPEEIEEILKVWPQARGELTGFANHLQRSNAGITALQLRMTIALAELAINHIQKVVAPIPVLLHCPACHAQHVDAPEPENDWTNPPHRSHLCHACGCRWRPADVETVGVASIASRGSQDTWPL